MFVIYNVIEKKGTAQNVRRKKIEISPVLSSISNQNLEVQVYKALSLTGIKVEDKRFTCMSRHEKKRQGDS